MAESQLATNVSKIKVKHAKSEELIDGLDVEEYALRKRLPRRLPKRKNDVYVSKKTNFRAQIAR